jgi:selenocysteine-specific elongation factor
MTTDLILGTAGHIDHGKTSLIYALTGCNTDRLPEEKRRGITIELGFAELELPPYRLGIVDVPGHERFVRQMLAGATGMDLVLLVVAADESAKPQTLEHLHVISLLDLPAGVIALTKCDLADADWLELVEEELRELVADTPLRDSPIVRTSSTTGEGLDQLRSALSEAAQRSVQRHNRNDATQPFRMPIDRVFSMEGYGTVVTGSVASGRVEVGDTLCIQPGDLEVRVRGLQNHDRTVDSVHRGQRAAINLAGMVERNLTRGQELAAPGHLVASRLLTVDVELLPTANRPLKDRAKIRLHIGATEALATVKLLGPAQLEPGASCLAQLYLLTEVVTIWNQPFVLRSESPVTTIGGGRVLVPVADKLRGKDERALVVSEQLKSDLPLERAEAALYLSAGRPWSADDLVRTTGISDPADIAKQLRENGTLIELSISATRTLTLHRQSLEDWSAQVEKVLNQLHDEQPLRRLIDRAELISRLSWIEPSVLSRLLERLSSQETVTLTETAVGLGHRGPQLTQADQLFLDSIVQRFQVTGFQPPTEKEIRQEANSKQIDVRSLIDLATADGDLVHISGPIYLHAEHEAKLRNVVRECMAEADGMTVSDIRELLGTSRKFAIPFCEYLDRVGLTRRRGDLRFLA